jgi:hypothetical protein
MKDLKILFNKNLTLVTYNLTEHKKELISGDNEKFKDVPCLTALRMSSNVPIIFSQSFEAQRLLRILRRKSISISSI